MVLVSGRKALSRSRALRRSHTRRLVLFSQSAAPGRAWDEGIGALKLRRFLLAQVATERKARDLEMAKSQGQARSGGAETAQRSSRAQKRHEESDV